MEGGILLAGQRGGLEVGGGGAPRGLGDGVISSFFFVMFGLKVWKGWGVSRFVVQFVRRERGEVRSPRGVSLE